MAETCMASDFDFPCDDLVQLSIAFNMLGKHRFGRVWMAAGDMTIPARIGQFRRHSPDIIAMARWANKAIVQCVRNGWLPVIYFEGDRRFRYFDNPNGREVSRVHIRPIDHDERGQVEFDEGNMAYCMVDVDSFPETLKNKYPAPSTLTPGPSREFAAFDTELDAIFRDIPVRSAPRDVIAELKRRFSGDWPERTTRYERIREARQRALDVRR